MQRLISNSILTIDFDHTDNWLYVDWAERQDFQSVKAGCLQMLDTLKAERCTKVLNDNWRVQTIWAEAAEWGGNVWFPAMAEAGLEYFAWVYSPSLYSRLSTDQTLQHTSRPIIATFDDIDVARRWLRQM